jgi:hypothetical protein
MFGHVQLGNIMPLRMYMLGWHLHTVYFECIKSTILNSLSILFV